MDYAAMIMDGLNDKFGERINELFSWFSHQEDVSMNDFKFLPSCTTMKQKMKEETSDAVRVLEMIGLIGEDEKENIKGEVIDYIHRQFDFEDD